MGIYSKQAEKAYLESGLLLNKASEDYYKSKMFYGNIQAYIDASNETEAKYFAARAINDFDTFCKCYAPEKDEKLNGIVVKPVGEVSNMFIACCTDLNGDKIIEKVTVREGKVVDVTKKIITNEAEIGSTNNEKGKPYNNEIMVMDKNQNDYKKEEEAEDKKYEKQQELKNETTNLARDF